MQRKADEEWRRCISYPEYEVSSEGRVRSWKNKTSSKLPPEHPRLLTPYNGDRGYITVHIRSSNINKPVGIHTLVCQAWHGDKPFHGAEIRHLDGDRYNNRPENLCWGTSKENAQDKIRHGRQARGMDINTNKLSETQVIDILSRPTESAHRLGKEYGVYPSTICRIRKGITWVKLSKEQKKRLEEET